MRLLRLEALVVVVILGLLGCGRGDLPNLAPVSGRVTLDGKPLVDKEVIFIPPEGRPSIGRTDEDGDYEMMYTIEIKGAIVGPHEVRISTPLPEGGDYSGYRETVPKKYNLESTLKEEVTSGRNTKNFELTAN